MTFTRLKTLTLLVCTLLALSFPGYVNCANKKGSQPAAAAPPLEPEAVIEEVNAKQLEKLLADKDYVAVFWYARSCVTCDKVLAELEKIDDDTDSFGVDFVKINDKRLAKQYGIKNFPALTYFREKEPIIYDGDLMDEEGVLDFLTSLEAMDLPDRIEEVNAKILLKIIEDTDFVAVLFYKEDDPDSPRVLRHIELIDDEAAEYGIYIVKMHDKLMAKKYGYRNPPGLTYFRKGKYINYDGDIDDEEEVLDWLTSPSNMEMTDHIEQVNRKMFEKIRKNSDYVAVIFYSDECKQCPRVLAEVEHIDDDADKAGIDFVKIDDKQMAKEYGVFALPAIVFFKPTSKEPVIYAGDLYEEEQILSWLLTQKDPSGDVIEDLEGERLVTLIEESGSIAVYFWNKTKCDICSSKAVRKARLKKEREQQQQEGGTASAAAAFGSDPEAAAAAESGGAGGGAGDSGATDAMASKYDDGSAQISDKFNNFCIVTNME